MDLMVSIAVNYLYMNSEILITVKTIVKTVLAQFAVCVPHCQ